MKSISEADKKVFIERFLNDEDYRKDSIEYLKEITDKMRYTIGKLKIKQVEGTTADDILYEDENGKQYNFDEYLTLIKNYNNE